MTRLSFTGLIILFASFFIQGADTIQVKQTRIPILIDRTDNSLFYMRIDAVNAKVLNEVKLLFSEDVNLDEIEAVRLYYGGTEAPQRMGETYFYPVQYISSHVPGKTREANPSYSVKIDEVRSPGNEVTLTPDYTLFQGINYFWISLQMKAGSSLLSVIDVVMISAKLDRKELRSLLTLDVHHTIWE